MSKRFPRFLAVVFSLLLLLQASAGFAEEAVKSGVSPTTGLPTDKPYRPVLVQIGNDWSGRPAYNLSEADIVYEFVIWGPGHTRYLALYNDQHPSVVTPVRSIRVNTFELREEWDCPAVFWSGVSSRDLQVCNGFFRANEVRAEMLFTGNGRWEFKSATYGPDVLFRVEERQSPHNCSVNVEKLVSDHWPTDIAGESPHEPRPPKLHFSSEPPPGGFHATKITIAYDTTNNYVPEYTYNEETRLYERWYCGEKQFDGKTGKRIVASNVIVQYANIEYYKTDLSQPIVQTTGEGIIHAFIDGWHHQGTWKRTTLTDQTEYFDANGDPLVLLPSKTFIQIVPPDLQTIWGQDGTYSVQHPSPAP